MFHSEKVEDGYYNCNGCGTYKNLKVFHLPETRQQLILCYRCQRELEETLRGKKR